MITHQLKPALAAIAIGLVQGAAAAELSSPHPNVVFIIADDMNAYGFYHELPGGKMPHMDAFRKTAVTLDRAYCAAPSCVPSRASFFSGQYPFTTGSYLNGSDPWQKPAMANIESLPEVFRRSGYETWGGGKLFHAPVGKERERAAWDNAPTHGGGFGPFVPETNQLAGQWWGATPWTGPDRDFPDVVNATAAVEFVKQKHDRPFFLVLGLWRPHTPFTAPKRFFELYDESKVPLPPRSWQENDLADVPEAGRELAAVFGERWTRTGNDQPDLWRKILRGYLACTSFADWSLGCVIEALDASPYAANTIVIVTSDNGYHCGEKNHFEKSTLWEAAARVPLAIRLPGQRNAGEHTGGTVTLVDLFPTLLDYCGLASPKQKLEGRSLRPLLENPTRAWERPAFTIYEDRYFSARDGRYRYIQYPDGTEELYDHERDPHEFTNIANRQESATIKQRFEKWKPATWTRSLGGRKG
jgi:arylsulfatase A-like enzyme